MRFNVSIDDRKFAKDLEKFLEGLTEIFKEAKKMTGPNAKEVGKTVLLVCNPTWDMLVEKLRDLGGEHSELVCADYYYAKALAYGMLGKTTEGQAWLDRGRDVRVGGGSKLFEWCQTYYRNN